ncbi:Rha family transcriptional regulator [Pseudomonas syringae pv. syringae]|uniref:Rha family transcriptional regulator n=1 Tax=Pseudomonas syringae TaxID=317 RepID=UPI001F10889A|nr:Rha family transcriptional regulator [Pseudomonas syringae]MCH5532048.1 Rha family transcriptional regulator [Pseudomonas syringae pv. syringae]MCH5542091.1 Rha family transcriptional regulator [Pseudomonas syringae pv. syringae]MCH5547120.1 Rha family transcriptional regulator [Pseudomonas syringae pv. syringae]MCH5604552.1 Rha family transcriptional regulator [Pseudomonas syringae pv. syringae]MCH5610393.1 Rha family transcriptional regulator [Pseudomonas syringae pv. syringae]
MNVTSNTVTMTTVEIAELTGKRHDNVLRDARAIVSQVNALKSEAIEATYTDGRGREKPMLVLDKHLTFTLITGYDTGLRYNVVGRWIELEQAANPAFTAQAITATLNELQARVNDMAPAFDEHVRKGRTVGYSWREACRLADIDHPDKLLDLLIAMGNARKTTQGHTKLHPKYEQDGFVKTLKPSNLVVSKNGGHLFKVTHKGLNEWLKAKVECMNAAVKEAAKPKVVKDDHGYVVKITGENTSGMLTTDI